MGAEISENISLVHSKISENSFTLNKNEGRHHPDHQEEVDGHVGIGNGSGVDCSNGCLRYLDFPKFRGMAMVLKLLSR